MTPYYALNYAQTGPPDNLQVAAVLITAAILIGIAAAFIPEKK